tara:strand:+ start:64 stop:537 length:474 start_codon:yes stop_codon:yes gene_type:complete
MKFKILLYLFLFVCIALFYQIFNTNKILTHQDALIQNEYQNNKQLKESLMNIESYCETTTYFSLQGNPNLKKSEILIKDEKSLRNQLLKMNSKGGLSSIIEIPDEFFLINQIRVVNEYWVLIGFQSDLTWGQAILEFKRNKKKGYDFKNLSSFVAPL